MASMVKTIALVSQKGGGGKTTLSVALAVAHERERGGAVVADVDPQGTAAMWGGLRSREAGEGPPVVPVAHGRLERTVAAALEAGASLVVMDTAPRGDKAAREAARLAELVLIPARPSIPDLHSVASTLDVCEAAGAADRSWVLLNGVPPRGLLAQDAERAVKRLSGRVVPVRLVHRVAHVHAFAGGRTAQEEQPGSKAAREVAALYRWVASGNNVTRRRR